VKIYSMRRAAKARDPIPPAAVRVDRGTPWGNPFKVPPHTQEEAMERFREYALRRLENQPAWLEPLRGKDLVCWCQSPSDAVKAPCHAEILMDLANREWPVCPSFEWFDAWAQEHWHVEGPVD